MQPLRELCKLAALFQFLARSIWQSVFRGETESKRFLTGLHMRSQYAQSQIPSVSIATVGPDSFRISALHYRDSHQPIENRFLLMETVDLMALLALLHQCKPKRIFEFGLMNGGTLLHFFLNTDESVTIDSLDINTGNIDPVVKNLIAQSSRVRIHQGDSLQFNPSRLNEQMDFILIDGGHDYAVVKNDTEKALAMLSKGGTIVWDDYVPACAGVFSVVNDLARQYTVQHIRETKLAFLTLSGQN